ncbi:MAG: DNA-processing protein DprA [Bacteroidales bacterium]|nr:DNA-processing protein DprA [Bacteroidales bacterium]
MNIPDETLALCALNKIFGYHPRLALQRIAQAGSALALFDGSHTEGELHPELLSRLVPRELEWAQKELERVREGGFRFIGLLDEDYPSVLREIPDPPLGLYLNGTSSPAEIFEMRPLVAFVGTRDLSPYGKAWCEKLVKALAETRAQPAIVSGLALGADGVAHRTALQCGLPTVGVMATGIETVYPRQHERLAMDMVRSPSGALVTDYPLDTAPVALNFVRRNRIIAGLSRAVVVIESKSRGGSLMTAKYAVEYSREVFAVPGRLEDLRSAGCNSLIRTQMAQIVTSAEDLVDSLGMGGSRRHRAAGGSWVTDRAGDSPEERFRHALVRRYAAGSALIPVALAIFRQRGIGMEELAQTLQRPYGEVLAAVGTLEADGVVTSDFLRRCSVTAAWE